MVFEPFARDPRDLLERTGLLDEVRSVEVDAGIGTPRCPSIEVPSLLWRYTPKGNVSGGSPRSHSAVRSSGSTARVSSK